MPNLRAASVVRRLGVCTLLLTSLAAAAQTLPACLRVAQTADAEFVPQAEALVRERNQLLAAVPEVFGGSSLLTPSGRAIARAYIGTVERNTDDEQRLWLQHETAIREGLQRELASDAGIAVCVADYDLERAETEPLRLRRFEATQQSMRAARAFIDAVEGMVEAINEFGSSGRVPRTDARYVALVSGMERMQATLDLAARLQDAVDLAQYMTRSDALPSALDKFEVDEVYLVLVDAGLSTAGEKSGSPATDPRVLN